MYNSTQNMIPWNDLEILMLRLASSFEERKLDIPNRPTPVTNPSVHTNTETYT